MQRHFDRDIDELKHLLLRMGAMVEDAMARSIRALLERDTALANEVIARDDEIDRMEIVIDQKTIELIAKMQPTASDLRFVATIMKITPELERIADLAQDVCERAIELNREPMLKPVVRPARASRTTRRPWSATRSTHSCAATPRWPAASSPRTTTSTRSPRARSAIC